MEAVEGGGYEAKVHVTDEEGEEGHAISHAEDKMAKVRLDH